MKLLVFLGLLFGSFVLWKVSYPSYSFHYKITVEIETPEGVKSGSAVRRVTVSRQPKIGDSPSLVFDVRGEAVPVDMGERGIVFSLINWDSDQDVYQAFKTMARDKLKVGMKALLPEDSGHYPRFVSFADINDPKSVTLVYSQSYSREEKGVIVEDHFAELLGEGVKLKQITIEITDEPVTWRVEKLLPWLPKVLMSNIDGTVVSFENRLSNTLHGGNFKTGG